MEIINIAIAGTGRIARDFLTACTETGIRASTIWSPEATGVQAKKLSVEFDLEKYYTDERKLLTDGEINTVYFPVSGEQYFKLAKEVLCAGKNILIDADFTVSREEILELLALAEASKSYLFELITYQQAETWEILKRSITKLGQIRLVQVSTSLLSSWLAESHYQEGAVEPVEHMDLIKLNLRNLTFLSGLFGQPESIEYFANKQMGIDTSGVMVLKFPGFIATAAASRDSLGLNSFIIQGSHGFIRSPENPYSFHAFDLVMLDGTEHVEAVNPGSDSLYSELRLFRRMLLEKDYRLMEERMGQKLDVLEILEIARQKEGFSRMDPL